jgi:hypothetical protein
MKTTKINFTIAATALYALLTLSSCGNAEKNHEHSEDTEHPSSDGGGLSHEGGEHIYACPMHPEVTGKEGDKCQKCGMKLEHNDNAAKPNENSYYMDFKTSPENLEAEKEATLSFTPKIKDKENALVPLDITHEKKIHLIIVNEDLSYFEHIHPAYTTSGAYEIKVLPKGKNYTDKKGENETKFENGGNYILFADYKPSGGNHTLDKIDFKVNGNTLPAKKFTSEKLIDTSGDYNLTLQPENGKFITGSLTHITGTLKKNGKEIDANTLGNYLGAKAHMVVIGIHDKNYLHVHPEVENGKFDLHTTFEKAGIYRGWLQFKADDNLHTVDFTIVVKDEI